MGTIQTEQLMVERMGDAIARGDFSASPVDYALQGQADE
jgi:hypothetical protein